MNRILFTLFVALTLLTRPAFAQQSQVWVQVEAHPTLSEAENAIRRYAQRMQDVNGFALDGGWYGVALGPYSRDDAARVLFVLRNEGAIPRDSYIAFPSAYRRQFYPVGADFLTNGGVAAAPADPVVATPDPTPAQDTQTDQPVAAPVVPDETPAEARRSERALSRDERKDLQVALQWAGFYEAAIDGAFGPGTRRSMSDWQKANGHEATGVLTTAQRAELFAQYNAVLDGLGLKTVDDARAGVSLLMPTALVEFDHYEAPFAHYNTSGDVAARVILISQEGDKTTLAGLYEIMQTLEIVPEDGPRKRGDTSFTLEGRSARHVSYTEAALEDGKIKGFTLVWPAGDEERRTRVLGEMRASFRVLDGVLDAAAGMDAAQKIDLVSGLQVRKPILSRSGFYVDDRGTTVTVAEAVQGCGRITLDGTHDAQVVGTDAATGLAVLRPVDGIAPMAAGRFSTATPRLQSDVAVAGFPYEGILGAPSVTFGKLADLRGLNGEDVLRRLDLSASDGDAGGPVFDAGGGVIGVLLPTRESDRRLPGDVRFAVAAQAVIGALDDAGITPQTTGAGQALAPEDLIKMADSMTVLVGCWE